ncbi:MAG: lipid II flippase MurJ [Candidatus Dojkabacteria bacterium]|nr:lipid II flippase MurJ [Candidatus Dojkabacteria bacterium]
MIKKNSVFSVMFLLLLTKVLGFWKLRIFAQLFGASHELDIFWAAFTIPDIIFMVVVAGSINAAIIPILTDELYDKGKKSFNKLFKHLTIYFFLLTSVLILIAFIFSPQITDWIVNNEYAHRVFNIGYRINEGDYPLFLNLFRIGLLSPLFLSLSAFVTAFLQVKKQFFITSLAPLFYNLAIVFGTYILVKYFELDVTAIAISAVLGSVIHLLVQIPLLKKYYKENEEEPLDLKEMVNSTGVMKAFKLAYPRMLGVLGEQFNTVVNTFISFTLTAGTLSAYRFAYSLHLFPVNIIGSAVAQVALPDLAKYCCKGQGDNFKKVLNDSIQLSLYLIFPIIGIMLVLRLPIVRLIYGTGAFDWQDTLLTAWCLALLSVSVVGQTVVQILLRAFYALKNTWKPLVAISVGIVVNLLGAYYLTNFFSHYYDWRPILEQVWVQVATANGQGVMSVLKSFLSDTAHWMTTRGDSDLAVGGLALSLSLAYFVQMVISSFMLNRIKKVLSWKDTMYPALLKLLNTLIMIVGMYFVFRLFDFQFDTTRTVYILILSAVTSIYGGFSYLIGSKIFSPKEFKVAEKLLKNMGNKFFRNGTNLRPE